MLSDQEIEAAHPEAFDFVFGNLTEARSVWFHRHLEGCSHCQRVVTEYSEIGQIIQSLPPHAEAPADLEDRTVAAMISALPARRTKAGRRSEEDEDQAATRVYPAPEVHHSTEPETQTRPRLQFKAPAEPDTQLYARPAGQPTPAPPEAEPQARPPVTVLPVWRRHPRRLATVAAVAAAVIVAAIIVIPRVGTSPSGPVVAISLHATTAAELIGDGAAAGRATAHQAGPSWTFQMTVHGLKVLPGNNVYQCWWVGPASNKTHPQFVSGGTFVVDNSGSTTVTMTTGVDPRDFRTMEVTAEPPGTGALTGAVLLTSQTL